MTKKILFILFICIVSILSIQCSKESKQAKNQKSYEVKSKFYYRDDDKYTENKVEFKVGETVYMSVNIEINEKKEKSNWVFVFVIVGAIIGAIIAGAISFGTLSLTGAGIGAAVAAFIAKIGIPIFIAISSIIGGGIGVGSSIAKDELTPSLNFVECELIIPNITSVDARYLKGGNITPLIDEVAGITTYPMKIGISYEKSEDITNSFLFQFIPNKESEISMRLIFDDNIAEQYDRMNTLIFVK